MKRRSTGGGPPAGRRKPPGWTIWAAAAALTLGFGSPRVGYGWGRNAHRAATRVAESRLTPEARAAVRSLLEPGESLVDASTWADENSRDIPGSASWHFVNVPITARRYTPSDCRGNCVVSRLEEFRKILADPKAPRPRRQMALRYVVHLVEDAHQPMHVGDNRDRGGNNVQLSFFRDDFTNLHQVWDSGLLREGYRGERDIADALFDLARRPEAQDWTKGDVEDWINESLEAARLAYRVPGTSNTLRSGSRIGRDYEDANLPIVTERLARAGVRLSEVLNEALSPPRKNTVPPPHFNRPGQTKPVPPPPAAGIKPGRG
ncbi:S1/P1 nuclease [Aquisphaera insulae]|uniref:S1/P1 nuclease n=1 Tax=Aquisphaera insulae TaxID=2712864 RepID=UPI0013ED93F7|nr:S1/P1 nuclease [Aquisphaera insulae]